VFSDDDNLPSLLNPIEVAFVSMQVTGARCRFVRYNSSVFRSVIYVCPMVNMSITFLESVTLDYAKFALLVSLNRTIRGL
jgi:hypothetical protein